MARSFFDNKTLACLTLLAALFLYLYYSYVSAFVTVSLCMPTRPSDPSNLDTSVISTHTCT